MRRSLIEIQAGEPIVLAVEGREFLMVNDRVVAERRAGRALPLDDGTPAGTSPAAERGGDARRAHRNNSWVDDGPIDNYGSF